MLEDKIIPIGFHNQYNKNYSQIFRQSRDAVRFLNGFKITYRLIGEEVEFECLLILEFVKFRFPRVYDIIYEKSDQFLYRKPAISVYQEYFLPSILKNSNGGSSTKFRIYIDQLNYLKLEDKELLDNLFQMLFNGGEYYPPQASNSISYPLYFEVYFRSRLSSYDISDKEYKYALQSDKLIDFIRDCASKNLHQGLLTRFMQEDIYKSRTHFELIIQAIFNLGPLLITKSSLHSFPYGILQNKIDNYDNEIADNLYGGNTESYKSFIQSLFDNSRPNYLFENQLIYNIKERGREFILSAETLTAYQISYFKRYAESDHGLCPNAMWLFWGIREYYTIPGNRPDTFHKIWRFEPSVTPYIKKYLKDKDPKHFLKFSIQTEMRDKKSICIQKVVIDIFDEPAEYKNLIISNEALDPEIKSEYLQLFDKCEREGFQRYVNMELQTELRKEE